MSYQLGTAKVWSGTEWVDADGGAPPAIEYLIVGGGGGAGGGGFGGGYRGGGGGAGGYHSSITGEISGGGVTNYQPLSLVFGT